MNAFVENLEHNFKLNFTSSRKATITAGGSIYSDPSYTITSNTDSCVTGLLNECFGTQSSRDEYIRDAFKYSCQYNDTSMIERIAEHAGKSGWVTTYIAEAYDTAYDERRFTSAQDARDFVSERQYKDNATWHICSIVLILDDENGKRIMRLDGNPDGSGILYSFSFFHPNTVAYILDANGETEDEFRKDVCLKVMSTLFARAFHWIAYSNIG